MLNENVVLSNIFKTVFPGVRQYETDVPKNFNRPCFLFINPDKSTQTRELTKSVYELSRTYVVYSFMEDGDVDALAVSKDKLLNYLIGVKKYLIPETDNRYFTIEAIDADTDDVNFMIEFTIRVSQRLSRDTRKPEAPKIQHVVNTVTIE